MAEKSMRYSIHLRLLAFISVVIACGGLRVPAQPIASEEGDFPARERISINEGWRFMRYAGEPDKLIYDERPTVSDRNDNKVADTKPSEEGVATSSANVLKNWILPTANDFINDPAKHHQRPNGNPGRDFPFVQN